MSVMMIKVPILIANPRPFRLALRTPDDSWSPSIEQINNASYDYVVGPEIFISAGAQSLRWRSELVEGEVAQRVEPVRRHARHRAQAQ